MHIRVCVGATHKGAHSHTYTGYHWFSLATIDLVGDNREFEV